jgi:hypothetical protein
VCDMKYSESSFPCFTLVFIGLQKTLNCFEKCCDLWKLTVNTTKTKVVIFSKKKVRQNQSFKIKGQNIEIIDSYCYLGTFLNLKKRKRDPFSPCLTPVCDIKYSESSFPCFTLVFIF